LNFLGGCGTKIASNASIAVRTATLEHKKRGTLLAVLVFSEKDPLNASVATGADLLVTRIDGESAA
jgi:hypothetical protein